MLTQNEWIKKEKVFEGQHAREEVIAVIRRHWFNLVWPAAKVFLGLLLVFIVFRIAGFWSKFSWLIFLLWLIVGGIYFLVQIYNWYRDRYILTSERVINFQQRSLFSRAVIEAPYENIQDISYEVNGFWATVLGFGDVRVDTAGRKEGIILEQVARPRKLKTKIVKINDIVMRDQKEDYDLKQLVKELRTVIKK